MSESQSVANSLDCLKNRFQRGLSFFPALMIGLAGYAGYRLLVAPSLLALLKLLFVLYAIPLLTYRIISLFAPLQEGHAYISGESGYNAWMGAMKIQAFYSAFPFLERALIMIPGAYSLWLRLWGSKIGKYVYWTPQVEVVDRTHLEIGDFAVFGNRCYLSPHVVRVKNGRILLYFKRIKIGSRAFIGFCARLGPGVTIADGAIVPAATDLYPNQVFPSARAKTHEFATRSVAQSTKGVPVCPLLTAN